MFELTNSHELISGERYYIKRKGIHKNSIGVFQKYNNYGWYDELDIGSLAVFNILDDANDHILDVGYEIDTDLNTFYRIITQEEFYKKMKEKYDTKCFNVVLKRLVNENFIW